MSNIHKRGFASLSMERRREIAAMGGKNQGKHNNAGNFANNLKKAKEAGRKGGLRPKKKEHQEESSI